MAARLFGDRKTHENQSHEKAVESTNNSNLIPYFASLSPDHPSSHLSPTHSLTPFSLPIHHSNDYYCLSEVLIHSSKPDTDTANMSPASWTAAALMSAAAGLLAQLPTADGHLYMMNPVSRNLYGTAAFQEP